MSKNQIQYQKGYSLLELLKDNGTEEQCATALFAWKCLKASISLNAALQAIAH